MKQRKKSKNTSGTGYRSKLITVLCLSFAVSSWARAYWEYKSYSSVSRTLAADTSELRGAENSSRGPQDTLSHGEATPREEPAMKLISPPIAELTGTWEPPQPSCFPIVIKEGYRVMCDGKVME